MRNKGFILTNLTGSMAARLVRAVALALIVAFVYQPLVPLNTGVYAQRNATGIMRIQVLDKDAKPLAGATVTLFNELGQPVGEANVTNNEGELEIAALPVGKYRLQVSAENHQPLDEQGIEVLDKAVTRLSLQLSEKLTVSDVVTVQAESDKLIETQAAPTAQFTQEVLKTVPLMSREFDQALPTVPNVIRGPDGRLSIKGAREDQSGLLVNSSDATDPATGNFALSVPLESISKVQVFTNPYLPEYGKFVGGVTRVETKRGGDKFKIDFTDLFPEPRIKNGQIIGIASFSPRIHLEGPIIKDRFFFSQGLEYKISKRPVRGLPFPDNETRRFLARSFTQFDYIISPQQTLTVTINGSERLFENIGLDFFNQKRVAPDQRVTDISLGITDRLSLSGGSLIETIFQYKRLQGRVFGDGPLDMNITPIGRDGNFFHQEGRTTERYELRVIDTLPPIAAYGTHNVKLGVDISYSSNQGRNTNRTVNILRQDRTLAQRIDYQNEGILNAINTQVSAYAQDQWLINPKLSFDYGIRFEAQRSTASVNIMPRTALSFSPTESGNTVFRAAFGLFYDKVPLNALSFANQPRQTVTTFAADGRTIVDGPRTFVNLLAPRNNGDPNTGADFDAPRNTTFSLEFNQRVNPKTLLKIAYLDSRTRNDLFVSPFFGGDFNSIMLFNNGRQQYRSLEVTTNFKLPRESDLTVSYIRSRALGELNDFNTYFGDFPEPVIRANQFGRLSSDAPNRLLARGTFRLPWQFTLAPLFDLHTGFPYSLRNELQDFVGTRNSVRFPRFISLDLAISKDVRLLDKYKARFTVSIFNVTNHKNPRNVKNNLADPQFGLFFANFRRFYRLDFDFTW